MNRNGNNKIFGQYKNENKMNDDFLKSREYYKLLSYNNFYLHIISNNFIIRFCINDIR